MDTCFQMTKHFHKLGGLEFPEKPVIRPSQAEVTLGLSLIAEEFTELLRDGFGCDAWALHKLKDVLQECIESCSDPESEYDWTGALDALADLNVVNNRLGGVLGFDMNEADLAVYQSNCSKFTRDLEVAKQSRAKYMEQGIFVTITRIIEDGWDTWYVLKNAQTGKILKANTYQPPVFKQLGE